MKDKSREFPMRLVLHKHDERQIRRNPLRLVLHKNFWEKNNIFLNKAIKKGILAKE
jgi:hypothetical protein